MGSLCQMSDLTYIEEENQSHTIIALQLKVAKSFFPLIFLSRVTYLSLTCIWHHSKQICDVTNIYNWHSHDIITKIVTSRINSDATVA